MNIYDDLLSKDPCWHHKEYPSISIEDIAKAQSCTEARKNELIEWAYCELRRLSVTST